LRAAVLQLRSFGMLNWPNRITVLRILLIAPFVILLLNLHNAEWPWARHAALAIFLVVAATDWADGYLARRLKAETDLGKFLDPLADKLLVTCGIILLSLQDSCVEGLKLPNWLPVVTVGKDLLVVIGFLLVKMVSDRFHVEVSAWGKACTVIELALVAAVLIAPDLPAWFRPVVPVMWWLTAALAAAAAMDYIALGSRLVGSSPDR
jgi:CDP-diacylglycerol--glycerol-3-phosphate 3-phosphatidyltransferase